MNRPPAPKAQPRILGLDASLTGTGWYDLASGLSGKITPGKLMGVPRLCLLREKLVDVLESTSPQIIALEGYSYGSKGRGVFGIAEWGGVLRMALHDYGIPSVWIVPPHNLKKYVIGHAKQGQSGKEVMILKTFQRWGKEFSDHDICDAHGLAQAALCLETKVFGTKAAEEALAKAELLPLS